MNVVDAIGWSILALLPVGGVIYLLYKYYEMRSAQWAEFSKSHEGWDIHVHSSTRSLIAMNHDLRKIVLGTVTRYKTYNWSQIAAVEIVKDGASITSTNRGSQLLGAMAGGAVLGGVGLLLGGMTGSRRTMAMINEVSLRLIVDDRAEPSQRIAFVRVSGSGVDARDPDYRHAVAKTEHWYAAVVNAMRACLPTQAAPAVLPPTTGDAISQLWQLKQAGALTDLEFESQKAILLSSGAQTSLPLRNQASDMSLALQARA